jgi:hypothetical protein
VLPDFRNTDQLGENQHVLIYAHEDFCEVYSRIILLAGRLGRQGLNRHERQDRGASLTNLRQRPEHTTLGVLFCAISELVERGANLRRPRADIK